MEVGDVAETGPEYLSPLWKCHNRPHIPGCSLCPQGVLHFCPLH